MTAENNQGAHICLNNGSTDTLTEAFPANKSESGDQGLGQKVKCRTKNIHSDPHARVEEFSSCVV